MDSTTANTINTIASSNMSIGATIVLCVGIITFGVYTYFKSKDKNKA